MKLPRRRTILLFALFVALSFATVQACGPDWEPDVFVRATKPDDLKAFATGQLGILQSGYDSNELAVFYRYLNGARLSEREQQAYLGPPSHDVDWRTMSDAQIQAARKAEEAANPVNKWRTARNSYAPAATGPALAADYARYDFDFEPDNRRCPDAAFETAVLTMHSRARTWGTKSPWLANWIHAQDAVFSNCTAGSAVGIPAPAPADAPALLRADRAYQLAAAAFYAGRLDEARTDFEAIAQDESSPWHGIAPYLAARTLVRQAFANAPKTDPWSGDLAVFDAKAMQAAQWKLETLLKQPNPAPSRRAVQAELNFVRIRTEPQARMAEICAALADPGVDPNFDQDLKDLSFVLVKQTRLANPPPLLAWIHAVREQNNAAAVIAMWQQTNAQPWLVLALVKATPGDPAVPGLLSAAAAVEQTNPAYDTVLFHRIRLLTLLHRADEARALVDKLLPQVQAAPLSSRSNAFLGERMAVARSFQEFLKYAPRPLLESSSAGSSSMGSICGPEPDAKGAVHPCPLGDHPLEFDEDAASILNHETPLSLLVKAATSPELPANLRQDVTLAAWTRSVVLEDAASAAALAPHLPADVRNAAGDGIGFSAVVALLRNPGMRPYVEPGISHLVSYSQLDMYRNNWWCGDWYGQFAQDPWKAPDAAPAPFFSPAERKAASAESDRVLHLPCASVYLGRRVIQYAKAHPDDANVPQALALTVRATRFACLEWAAGGSTSADNTAVSKAAFQLLHTRYPNSAWTAKTRYYY